MMPTWQFWTLIGVLVYVIAALYHLANTQRECFESSRREVRNVQAAVQSLDRVVTELNDNLGALNRSEK